MQRDLRALQHMLQRKGAGTLLTREELATCSREHNSHLLSHLQVLKTLSLAAVRQLIHALYFDISLQELNCIAIESGHVALHYV